ncbi:hypothetical protein CJD36_002835 [Flavipsychrobacter stenotrophus]|uniref:Uncharacterized protein n=1 Tax=Flavipsychrobacter stenotrophus TaxID=2077091 RepID=A0A2S7T1G7_9BACT|nr:hypothetical protein [Flavipsychrobacter stenotrophus]PQJ12697.1 hypothetical protein CJD36_002835 [Flavipsychrobacter stenotrophus]
MSQFNFEKTLKENVEKEIRNKIRKAFPHITNFSVKYDVKKQKASIDGLTPEQIDLIMKP